MESTPYIRLYEINSIPLREVESSRIKSGDLMYSSTGKCFECVGKDKDGSAVFEQMHESELVEGEFLESIEDNHDLLTLFWKLSNRRLNKVKYASDAEDR